ncbi:MAG: PD-(D/E)XK nuclease family protein [Epsilonproteobacteria bacterium]|nr:PD-(D/E)XK nuclease family protein [Campylobacterota bacterium]
MLQTKKLVIYPTSRAVRSYIQSKLSTDTLLPKVITIGEFEKKALMVENHTFIDQDTRTLLLNEAASFSTFKALHIDREFFTFLKNAKFLFGFFDELAIELVNIDTLQEFDTYASFAEHIEILQTLLKAYQILLEKNNYIDKTTLPSLYKLNLAYLHTYDEIALHLEGYLNNFEFKLFEEISAIKPVTLYINTNSFNQKMITKLKDIDITLEIGYQYKIDLTHKKILSEEKTTSNKANFMTYACTSQLQEVAFVKKKIYDYIQQGIAPERIVVVLPNNQFASLLDLFDEENNLNFAMGFSYQKTTLYQKILAQYDYFTKKDHESRYRLERFGLNIEKIETQQKQWNQPLDDKTLYQEFEFLVNSSDAKEEECKIYLEELHLFSKLFANLKHQPFHKLLHLFLNRLSSQSIDDVRGGKVTVMEVLETRGVTFDAVIIVDFNEGIVPATSQKDLFLSSELRFLAKLPTVLDRENLQKYYYQRLFDQANEVAICYVSDEQNQPSRFLDELNISKKSYYIDNLECILFTSHPEIVHYQQEDLILPYDFTQIELSATSLKSFLDCRRKYYFQYIKRLDACEIPKDDNSDRIIGVHLHDALKHAYSRKNAYFDSAALLFTIQSQLYQHSANKPMLQYLVDLWMQKLKPFALHEIQRAQEGYIVKEVEKKYTLKIDNFTLIGQIDRVDQKNNYIEVIDYKSGKIPKESKKALESSSNFQLQFYHLLASQTGEVLQSYYYDLNTGQLVEDPYFDLKLDMLYKTLDSLKEREYNFTMTQDLKKCTFCPYIKICNRLL